MTRTPAHGFEKIAKVTAEQFLEQFPCGGGLYTELPTYEIVWIETTDGNLYSRSLNVGDTLEFLVKHYEKRGYIDSKCVFDRALSQDDDKEEWEAIQQEDAAIEASYDYFNRYIAGDR